MPERPRRRQTGTFERVKTVARGLGSVLTVIAMVGGGLWVFIAWTQDLQSKEQATIEYGRLEAEHMAMRAERAEALEKVDTQHREMFESLKQEMTEQRRLLWQIYGKVR